jgi:hypothetical protein
MVLPIARIYLSYIIRKTIRQPCPRVLHARPSVRKFSASMSAILF